MSTITLTTRDIYGTDEPPIPDGWEAGDLCRVVENSNRILLGTHGGPISEKQLVRGLVLLELRKKPALVKYEFECEAGREPIVFVDSCELRQPNPGEWYRHGSGSCIRAEQSFQYCEHILTPVQATKVER